MFKKADRSSFRVVGGFLGIGGAGKTYTALSVGKGLVGPNGKIALVSAGEHNAPAAYANDFDFDMCVLPPPYTLDSLTRTVRSAKDGGYSLVIIDSLSAFWMGTGGLQDLAAETKIRENKNDWNVWDSITPKINKMWEDLRASGIHVFLTVREKTAYAQEKNDRGKVVPKKIGLAPYWKPEPGLEYELDFVMNMKDTHHGVFRSKRLNHINDRVIHKPGPDFGELMKNYLEGNVVTSPGAVVVPPPAPPSEDIQEAADAPEEEVTARQKVMGKLEDLAVRTKRTTEEWFPKIAAHFEKPSIEKVAISKLQQFIKEFEAKYFPAKEAK